MGITASAINKDVDLRFKTVSGETGVVDFTNVCLMIEYLGD